MRLQNKKLYILIPLITITSLHGMDEAKQKAIAEIRFYRAQFIKQSKNQLQYQNFKNTQTQCPADKKTTNLLQLCPSCHETFAAMSHNTRYYLYAETTLKKAKNNYFTKFGQWPMEDYKSHL